MVSWACKSSCGAINYSGYGLPSQVQTTEPSKSLKEPRIQGLRLRSPALALALSGEQLGNGHLEHRSLQLGHGPDRNTHMSPTPWHLLTHDIHIHPCERLPDQEPHLLIAFAASIPLIVGLCTCKVTRVLSFSGPHHLLLLLWHVTRLDPYLP